LFIVDVVVVVVVVINIFRSFSTIVCTSRHDGTLLRTYMLERTRGVGLTVMMGRGGREKGRTGIGGCGANGDG